jgi:hypothetical protein
LPERKQLNVYAAQAASECDSWAFEHDGMRPGVQEVGHSGYDTYRLNQQKGALNVIMKRVFMGFIWFSKFTAINLPKQH